MPDYKKAKCYAIVGEDGREIYIGSTCQPLYRRFNEHKKDSRRKPEIPLYKYINDMGGWDNYRILLVEEYPCENKEQLNRREGEHIRRIQPIGNRQIPARTRAEWEDVNKEKLKIYRKEYAIKNREKWRLKDKERREQIQEQKNDWYDNNKKEIQEWYEINKEKIQNWYEPYKKYLKHPINPLR